MDFTQALTKVASLIPHPIPFRPADKRALTTGFSMRQHGVPNRVRKRLAGFPFVNRVPQSGYRANLPHLEYTR